MRLIDADEVIQTVNELMIVDKTVMGFVLMNAKTVDAVPVRHGRWIPYNSKYGHDEKVYLCDQCNNNVGFTKMNYCPNCGARMDEKGGNGNE